MTVGDRGEAIYMVWSYHDGPRSGIADFNGQPHYFKCEFDEVADGYASTFQLCPVSDEVLQLAIESHAIWIRWRTALQLGQVPIETHPALPEERGRYNELSAKLRPSLLLDPERTIRARAEFDRDSDIALQTEAAWRVCWSLEGSA